jgi:hypothetical protein
VCLDRHLYFFTWLGRHTKAICHSLSVHKLTHSPCDEGILPHFIRGVGRLRPREVSHLANVTQEVSGEAGFEAKVWKQKQNEKIGRGGFREPRAHRPKTLSFSWVAWAVCLTATMSCSLGLFISQSRAKRWARAARGPGDPRWKGKTQGASSCLHRRSPVRGVCLEYRSDGTLGCSSSCYTGEVLEA